MIEDSVSKITAKCLNCGNFVKHIFRYQDIPNSDVRLFYEICPKCDYFGVPMSLRKPREFWGALNEDAAIGKLESIDIDENGNLTIRFRFIEKENSDVWKHIFRNG